MAIQRLEIHGYRSFENATWEPGNLNLVVGPNGSGKSNLLRLLELISNTARGRLLKSVDKAGGMVSLLWDRTAPSLGWKLRIDPVDKHRDPVCDALTLEMDVAQFDRGSAYYIHRDTLGSWYGYEKGAEQSPYWIYTRDPRHAMVFDRQSKGLIAYDDFDPNESLLSQVADPRTNPIPAYTKHVLETWRVHHGVEVGPNSQMRQPVITQYSTLVEPDGSNLAAVLHTLYTGNRDFKQDVNEGMAAAFGKVFEELVFQPAAAQRIQLAVQWRSSSQPHAGQELSDGTLRFLFLLTVLASPEPAPLIAIDEPEAGLHPSMFPIIAEYAVAAAERTQVVITSHSPEFLDAFTEHSPHVTICHWEDGKSRLFPLPPAKLKAWLEKYRLGEMFTSGELDMLATADVEPIQDTEPHLRDLPAEGLPLPPD